MNTFDLERLIKKPTCFQSSNPRCIDLILTSLKELFENNEVGISDHRSFIVAALKSQLRKGNPKTKLYRVKNNFIKEYSDFQKFFLEILHKQANFFQKLNVNDLTDNKKFWKIIKPFFSNIGLNSNKLIPREKDVLIIDEKAIATLMDKYFVNITADLNLRRDKTQNGNSF